MNRKLLSLAVAAAITTPAAALADATLYGKVHVSIDWFDIKGSNEAKYKGWTLNRGRVAKGSPRANRLGIKGSEDLGSGLKAIYQLEFGLPLANERNHAFADGETKGGATGLSMRNTYVGLKGDFGTFLVGRHDTPLKISTVPLELFSDSMADNNGTIGFHGIRPDNIITYITPSIGGFQFAAAAIPGAGSTAGGDINRNADNLTDGYSLATTYGNGPWYASVAYEVLTDKFAPTDYDNAMTSDLSNTPPMLNSADFKKWRVGLGIRDLHGLYLGVIYERQKSINFIENGLTNKDNEANLWQGQIGYVFGNNMVKGMYGRNELNGDIDELKSWAIGLDHSFSKQTKVYAVYTKVDMDSTDNDWKGFSFGMIHNF